MPRLDPLCPPFLVRSSVLGVTLLAAQAGATAWLGGEVTTQGFGVHAGQSLLRVPLIGAVGIEAAAEKAWQSGTPNRYALGLTVRDLNLPLTRVDAFGTLGAEYRERVNLYAEGGLRGPLVGPAGWRAFARANSALNFSAGLGLELRF